MWTSKGKEERAFPGVIPHLERLYSRGKARHLDKYQAQTDCPECEGERLSAVGRSGHVPRQAPARSPAHLHRRHARVLSRARAHRQRRDRRRRDQSRDRRAPALPRRGRPQLSHARSPRRHARAACHRNRRRLLLRLEGESRSSAAALGPSPQRWQAGAGSTLTSGATTPLTSPAAIDWATRTP